AYGVRYPDTMEARMPELLEGLALQKALWQTTPDRPLTFDGAYYHVKDAVCTPHPVSQPPVWFGEAHPLTLDACARHGQGWNSVPVKRDELRRRLDALRAACQNVGTDYDAIEKSLEIQILITPDRASLRESLRGMVALTPEGTPTPNAPDFMAFVNGSSDVIPAYLAETWLAGTPDEVKMQLQGYMEMGFTHFMLWFVDAPDESGMRLFAEQVAPALKG
ncbi:MAG: LLM class flavin-dependent oxidoreductase, partial [Anaerolineae bacterium]|nr:LLM class flavin-dependent oxidoreductase [Anaerolineae bacterium]